MSFLFKSATIVDPQSKHHLTTQDILINDDGIIEKIGSIQASDAKVIQSQHLMISTGWLDLRCNFCDPGYEYKEDLYNGLMVAASGGFTGVVPLPNTQPVIQSKNDISYLKRFNNQQVVDVFPSGAVTKDCAGNELTEMLDMYNAGAQVFTDGHNPIWNTDILAKTLLYLQKTGGLLINRPEEKHLTAFASMHEGEQSTILGLKGMPSIAEEIMIIRDLNLLDYAGGRIHFSTISTERAIRLIKKAKKKEKQVSCDVASYQLVFDHNMLSEYDSNYKVTPPLREKSDIRSLIKGIKDDTIDAIVSGHEPQDEESKKLEFDLAEYGMLGLQTVLPNIVKACGKDDITLFIEKLTTGPRKVLNMTAPAIEAGERANLTAFDPDKKWVFNSTTNLSKSTNSPQLGMTLTGQVIGVINGTHSYFNEF